MKTSELIGVALDWAVAKCEGRKEPTILHDFKTAWYTWGSTHYSTDWAQGGPIIEREKISLVRCDDELVLNAERVHVRVPKWFAEHGGGHSRQSQYESENYSPQYEIEESAGFYGATPLEAAMRCYVASKLGSDVTIPEELK